MNAIYKNQQDMTEVGAGPCVTFLHNGISSSVFKSAPRAAEADFESPAANLILSDMSSSLMKLYFLPSNRYFTFPFVCPVACPKLSLLWWDVSSASQSFPQAGWASVAPFLAKSAAQISKCLVFILLHFFVSVHETLCLMGKQCVNIFHRDFLFFNKQSNFLK